jgi:hypothetical protein
MDIHILSQSFFDFHHVFDAWIERITQDCDGKFIFCEGVKLTVGVPRRRGFAKPNDARAYNSLGSACNVQQVEWFPWLDADCVIRKSEFRYGKSKQTRPKHENHAWRQHFSTQPNQALYQLE